MSLIRYINPELNNLSSFGNLRDSFGRLFDLAFPARTAESLSDWTPALDAHEDKDKFVVAVEIPSVKKEDMNVSVHDGVLTISGERRARRTCRKAPSTVASGSTGNSRAA